MDTQSRTQFLASIDALVESERLALYANPAAVAALAKRLAAAQGSVFVHDLDRSPGAIARLKAEAAFEGYVEDAINDERFQIVGTGVTPVRFRIVPGDALKREDGLVYRVDVEARFREMGMRFCDGAEALLPVAKDRQLGRGEHPYVALINGARGAFVVDGSGARRDLYLDSDDDRWFAYFGFVGVCEPAV